MTSTPLPEVILTKLDEFYCKWKDATDPDGNRLFTLETEKAVINLKTHITAGCLSNIPPGGGTNRNERFHRHINSFFNKSKIGIFLAYALLTVIIHYHNSQMQSHGTTIVRPISASALHGLVPKNTRRPIGIVPKFTQRGWDVDDHWEIDLTETHMDMEFIVGVYSTSIAKLWILRSLKCMKLTQLLADVTSLRPFNLYSNFEQLSTQSASTQERLHDYGLTISPSPRDGNCFFQSVAANVLLNPDTWKNSLGRLGILEYTSGNLPTKLRQAFVEEILGERRQHYQSFLTDVNVSYEAEAKKFLQS